MSVNLSYRCYILPVTAAVTYIFLSLPRVSTVFNDWIPNYYYSVLCKALIILVTVFLICRIVDMLYNDMCHDQTCTDNL